jgi:hypothetical protein
MSFNVIDSITIIFDPYHFSVSLLDKILFFSIARTIPLALISRQANNATRVFHFDSTIPRYSFVVRWNSSLVFNPRPLHERASQPCVSYTKGSSPHLASPAIHSVFIGFVRLYSSSVLENFLRLHT